MKAYLASGFFTQERRIAISKMAHQLRTIVGWDVFVPMEHIIENGWDMDNPTWAKKVFEMDKKAIDEADLVIVLDWGAEGDCGAAWECGYAYAKGKQVEVFCHGEDISLMIANGCTCVRGVPPEQK